MKKSIVYFCFFLLTITVTRVFTADSRCVMKFLVCPETFNNKTISVPYNVVGIAPSVLACKDTAYVESTGTNTAAIFFVIDNSGSMSGKTGSDPTGQRFTVTKALLDTIYQKQPNAQVGLAIFQQNLVFDTSTSSRFWYSTYFKTMSQVYDTLPSQAYMPLLTLNQLYNGVLGINILDSALTTTGTGTSIALRYTPNFSMSTPGGATNINIGFLAAREAFASATVTKNSQYIVFLSDGEANMGAHDPGQDSIFYFRDSTRNIPTTFTVFFNSGGSTTVPVSIQTMTQNIQNNGYSASNPSSSDFAITASFSSLLDVILSNVISRINVSAIPIQMIINNVSSTTYSNGQFVYQDTIRLGSTVVTPYTMQIIYRYTNSTTGQTHDSTEEIIFAVRRDSSATTPPGIALTCKTITAIPVIKQVYHIPGENSMIKIKTAQNHISVILPYMTSPNRFKAGVFTISGIKIYSTTVKALNGILNIPTWGFPMGRYFLSITNDNNRTLNSTFLLTR
jgi:hypothetical protein